MIEVNYETYCENCSGFDPVANVTTIFSSGHKTCNTTISCTKCDICKRIYEYIKEECE